jgi:hypothetical protein
LLLLLLLLVVTRVAVVRVGLLALVARRVGLLVLGRGVGLLVLGRGRAGVGLVGGGVAGGVVDTVGAGVLGQGLRFVHRGGLGGRGLGRLRGHEPVGRGGCEDVVLGGGVLVLAPVGRLLDLVEVGALERRVVALRVLRLAAAALAELGRHGGAVDGPALREALAERKRHVRLADREGGRAQADDRNRVHQDAEDHTEEADESEQPEAQPRLVLQQHLAEQPQRDNAECQIEDRQAHVRPSPSGRYAVCRTWVRPV